MDDDDLARGDDMMITVSPPDVPPSLRAVVIAVIAANRMVRFAASAAALADRLSSDACSIARGIGTGAAGGGSIGQGRMDTRYMVSVLARTVDQHMTGCQHAKRSQEVPLFLARLCAQVLSFVSPSLSIDVPGMLEPKRNLIVGTHVSPQRVAKYLPIRSNVR